MGCDDRCENGCCRGEGPCSEIGGRGGDALVSGTVEAVQAAITGSVKQGMAEVVQGLKDKLDGRAPSEFALIDWERLRQLKRDAERLDYLQALLGLHSYTGKAVVRWSDSGRGIRLHETARVDASTTVREAIDVAMASRLLEDEL